MSADFKRIADYYDIMYVDKDGYMAEAQKIWEISGKYNSSGDDSLLDIACGTGEQCLYLSERFRVTGVDLSEEMLEAARKKVPSGIFLKKDMFDFKMERRYGTVVNLYGNVGFAEDYGQLVSGMRCSFDCLLDGGVFILTPWGTVETFRDGTVAKSGQCDGVSFCRMETVKLDGQGKVRVDMFHLVAKDQEVRQFHHSQSISLFSEEQYLSALTSAGFKVVDRLSERDFRMGAFVCVK